jgi:hypothetical protein
METITWKERIMGMLIIRHQVKDYNKWRPGFFRCHSCKNESDSQTPPTRAVTSNPASGFEMILSFQKALGHDRLAHQSNFHTENPRLWTGEKTPVGFLARGGSQ